MAAGILERVAPAGEGLPMQSCDVIGRVSKGLGLAADCPTSRGSHGEFRPRTTCRSLQPLGCAAGLDPHSRRYLLAPVMSWSGASFSSLMPLGFNGGIWWVRARLVTKIDVPRFVARPRSGSK